MFAANQSGRPQNRWDWDRRTDGGKAGAFPVWMEKSGCEQLTVELHGFPEFEKPKHLLTGFLVKTHTKIHSFNSIKDIICESGQWFEGIQY